MRAVAHSDSDATRATYGRPSCAVPSVPPECRLGRRQRVLPLLVLAFVAGCGNAPRPLEPVVPPAELVERRVLVERAAHDLFRALADGDPRRLLADEVQLRDLLVSPAATRWAQARRAAGGSIAHASQLGPFASARLVRLCMQGVRVEQPGGPVGVRRPAWVFDRALVAAEQPGRRRIASWVEGLFVFTTHGLRAIDLVLVEAPRWEHVDLDHAICEVAFDAASG
ncbi:MAG: hypothetical protein NZ898_00690 [Myxococcota bacterium]|nr:hypothetical protein [Myxococcota bacterium]